MTALSQQECFLSRESIPRRRKNPPQMLKAIQAGQYPHTVTQDNKHIRQTVQSCNFKYKFLFTNYMLIYDSLYVQN